MEYVQAFPKFFLDLIQAMSANPTQLIEAGVVALFFGLSASCIGAAIFLPILGTIVYLAADHVIPALLAHKDIVSPVFDMALLQKAVAMYIVLLVAGGVVFAIKKAILGIMGK